ncbi:carbon-nitrogen hydrolase family protein [Arthrobacter sp. A5]|uniref:carbon-nitrogen hydrolase family protein n=1 Tax=Arthrobacter sp. A5 TaxID=576926 RepID=UPI003DA8E916
MVDGQQTEVTGGERPPVLTVGLLQTAPVFGEVDSNIARIIDLRDRLGNVDLVLTPELALNGYGFGPGADLQALTADDPRLDSLVSVPAAIGIGFAENAGRGLPRNTYMLADSSARTRDFQHKIHPVSYSPWNEHLSFEAGIVLETAVIRGARCATVICNDMWHPVVPWLAARAGAEVLIVPVASIDGTNPDQIQRTWQVILEHTALLLQCYVVFINRCGTDGGARFWGGSRILGPDGNTLANAGDSETILEATLDLAALRKLRADTPILAEARNSFVIDTLTRAGLAPEPRGGGRHV